RETAKILRHTRYTGRQARLRAAPRPMGIESNTPRMVETTVIVRLSANPARISVQRVTKSGESTPANSDFARVVPSIRRATSISTLDSATIRYATDPIYKAHRSRRSLICGGRRHVRTV